MQYIHHWFSKLRHPRRQTAIFIVAIAAISTIATVAYINHQLYSALVSTYKDAFDKAEETYRNSLARNEASYEKNLKAVTTTYEGTINTYYEESWRRRGITMAIRLNEVFEGKRVGAHEYTLALDYLRLPPDNADAPLVVCVTMMKELPGGVRREVLRAPWYLTHEPTIWNCNSEKNRTTKTKKLMPITPTLKVGFEVLPSTPAPAPQFAVHLPVGRSHHLYLTILAPQAIKPHYPNNRDDPPVPELSFKRHLPITQPATPSYRWLHWATAGMIGIGLVLFLVLYRQYTTLKLLFPRSRPRLHSSTEDDQ